MVCRAWERPEPRPCETPGTVLAVVDLGVKSMKKDGWTAEQKRAFSKLTRLLISGQDFQHALSAATFLLEEVSEGGRYRLEEMRRFRCYETTMVVAYARPFSMAKGEVGRFSFGDEGVRLSPPEKRLHEKVVKHRNTLYAHSDAELVEMKTYLMHIGAVAAKPNSSCRGSRKECGSRSWRYQKSRA
jgi:hypothetical protein